MLAFYRCGTVLALVCICVMAGCSGGYEPPKGVTVLGIIVKDDMPLVVPNREVGLGSVEIILVPQAETVAAGAEPFSTQAAEDGSFSVIGPGQGIMPGKYRLAVYQRDQGPSSDLLQGEFSETNSPIEVEVPASKSGGKHDLGKLDLTTFRKQ